MITTIRCVKVSNQTNEYVDLAKDSLDEPRWSFVKQWHKNWTILGVN